MNDWKNLWTRDQSNSHKHYFLILRRISEKQIRVDHPFHRASLVESEQVLISFLVVLDLDSLALGGLD